jgi:hypothetical protein
MKFNISLFVVFLAIMVYAGIQLPTGITGKTEKNGTGCTCHSPQRDLNVSVQIEGPDTLFRGETGTYQLTLTGGPAVAGGFNVASYSGILNPIDETVQIIGGELTHTAPKLFLGSSAVWDFSFTALDSVYTDTLYSASNSVNNDGSASSLDRWNFGNKFIVHIIERPSSIFQEAAEVTSFNLEQNYPNPFNPTTTISWHLSIESKQILKIFDSLGNEILTLVNNVLPAGFHSVIFNAEELTSGVYFYSLTDGKNSVSKKMLLLK